MGQYSQKYGMRLGMILLLSLFFFQKLTAQEKQVRIALCYDSTNFLNIEYRRAIGKSIFRTLSRVDKNLRPEIKFRSCLQIPSFSFYGNSEAVFGREEAFASLVEAAYWIAAEEALRITKGNHEEQFENCRQLDWIDAYRLAKAKLYFQFDEIEELLLKVQTYSNLHDEEKESLKSLVNQLHYHENDFEEYSAPDETFKTALQIYRALIDNATAFFIGHELYHFIGNKDIIEKKTAIENQGIFNTIISLHHPRRLFDPGIQPDLSEVRADRAGFRMLELVDKANESLIKNESIYAVVRRSTIDLLAFPILLGFNLSTLEGNQPPQVKIVKSYLYPQQRLLLLSATLNTNEGTYPELVKICGNTAKAIVTIIQTNVMEYPESDGDVPDEVLDQLPPGVTIGWETNFWNESSFDCTSNN